MSIPVMLNKDVLSIIFDYLASDWFMLRQICADWREIVHCKIAEKLSEVAKTRLQFSFLQYELFLQDWKDRQPKSYAAHFATRREIYIPPGKLRRIAWLPDVIGRHNIRPSPGDIVIAVESVKGKSRRSKAQSDEVSPHITAALREMVIRWDIYSLNVAAIKRYRRSEYNIDKDYTNSLVNVTAYAATERHEELFRYCCQSPQPSAALIVMETLLPRMDKANLRAVIDKWGKSGLRPSTDRRIVAAYRRARRSKK